MSSTSSLHLTESDSWPMSQALKPILTVTFHSKLSVSATKLSVERGADLDPIRSPATVRRLRGRSLQHYSSGNLSGISNEHLVCAFHHRQAGCCRQTLPAAKALGNNSDHALGAVLACFLPSGPAACWRQYFASHPELGRIWWVPWAVVGQDSVLFVDPALVRSCATGYRIEYISITWAGATNVAIYMGVRIYVPI